MRLAVALGASLLVAVALAVEAGTDSSEELQPPKRIVTSTYRLAVDRWPLPPGTRRPSLDMAGDALVLATNDGRFFRSAVPRPGRRARVDWTELTFSIPIDMQAMERGLGPEWGWALGVRDIFVHADPAGAAPDLYALYGVYVAEADCIVTRVGRIGDFLRQGARVQPERIYETETCLPLVPAVNRVGGRLAIRGGRLLVTIGSPENDKDPRNYPDPGRAVAQRWDSPLGKVTEIDLESGAVTHLAAGFRNPQGLHVANDGRVWLTDHGPRGGDELNLLREGANYGWPVVTYGTLYSGFTWPLAAESGRHEGFERPVYAWVPSVGISQLVQLEGAEYGRWQDDLLITSLKGQTLYRTRVEDGRVVFAEPIPLGHRLRDIVAVGGDVFIVTDYDLLLRLAPDYGRDSR